MLTDIIQYVALALTVLCVVLVWRLYRVTSSRAILFLMFGFAWWCVLKACLVAGVAFATTYSGSLSAGIGVSMAVGLWFFLRGITKYYNGNGGSVRNSIAAEDAAALLVRQAADAAAKTLEATALAAAEVLKAKEHAAETMTLTFEAEGHITAKNKGDS